MEAPVNPFGLFPWLLNTLFLNPASLASLGMYCRVETVFAAV